MENQNILIHLASDQAGWELKESIKKLINTGIGYKFIDYGSHSKEPVDYPDYVHAACQGMKKNVPELMILICGSGNGVAMTANKYSNVRAAVCWTPEIAALARKHNDANALCIPARYISQHDALMIVTSFLSTDFEGGRHINRVNKIPIPN